MKTAKQLDKELASITKEIERLTDKKLDLELKLEERLVKECVHSFVECSWYDGGGKDYFGKECTKCGYTKSYA